ncbi:DsbA family protein [Comamonas testosteroni]|uniref:Thioredoxin domain-containing protein n=1 Tax=Comamonas testosteroni TaxID=285 RepID=A0A096FLK8_COMTE|nr:DsbA family protein [Comamonas testosteroni]KGH30799.1 hypothetical protein P353_08035 [Comamonas testosteroni]
MNMNAPTSAQTSEPKAVQFRNAFINIFLPIFGLIIAGFLGWQLYKLNDITSSFGKGSSVSFKTEDEFNNAVAKAFNKIVEDKQKAMAQSKLQKFTAAPEFVPDGKHIYGSMDARYTLVEFSDLECPYCKRFHNTPKQLVDASKGNVNWQWMHYPLDFHNPAAADQAIASECISEQLGNRAFWAFLNDVFVQSRGNGQGVPNLAELATEIGADSNKFLECVGSGKYQQKIQEHMQKAAAQGIKATPATFVVDNHTGKMQLVAGAQPVQALMAAVSKLKAEAEEEAESQNGPGEQSAVQDKS